MMATIPLNPHLSMIQRKVGLNSLLIYTFFMVVGFSMLMPLIAVHFVNNVGLTTSLVGIALALRQTVQQGLTVIGGILCDTLGAKPMIFLGVLVRALGFICLASADEPTWLMFAMVLSALGGALFEAPYQATIIALTTKEDRSHYYIVSNWVGGVATTVGPLIGIYLLQFDFSAVCYGAAACFVLNSAISLFLLPSFSTSTEKEAALSNLGLVWQNKRFIIFTTIMMGYWFTSVQFNLSFPLWAEKLTGNQQSVGVMYALSAVITITLQYHLVKYCERIFNTGQILLLGMLIMSLSCAAIGLVTDFNFFLICVVIFSLGVLLTRPTQQAITASLANPNALGSFMGFSALGLAFGGGLGNWLGGLLIDLANEQQTPSLPWFIYSAVGLISTIALARLLKITTSPPKTAEITT
jgi:DHA1 family multidrug resistance protein-like MFS transporter